MVLPNLEKFGEYSHQSTMLARYGRKDNSNFVLAIASALNPIEGFCISDQATGATSFFGYLNKSGAWYLMKSIIDGNIINYTYATGSSGYDFSNRANENYQSFADTF